MDELPRSTSESSEEALLSFVFEVTSSELSILQNILRKARQAVRALANVIIRRRLSQAMSELVQESDLRTTV